MAALLGLAEMHAPGSYLIWMALGAALTAAVDAAYGLSAEAQLATMAVASGLSCLAGCFVYRRAGRMRSRTPVLNERNAQLVGERGVVATDIVHGMGKVRLGDTVWLAEGPDLPAGTAVIVEAVRRGRMRVGRADAAAAPSDHDATG